MYVWPKHDAKIWTGGSGPQISQSHGTEVPVYTLLVGATRVSLLNGISFCLAAAGRTSVTFGQNNLPYTMLTAMLPKYKLLTVQDQLFTQQITES